MPSTFRTAAAVVVLTALLGLSAVPANAQPKGMQAALQVETIILEALWHWLTDLRAPSGTLDQMQKAVTQDPAPVLNRGGAYDPNGRS